MDGPIRDLIAQALLAFAWAGGPFLVGIALAGFVAGFFQAATQINDAAVGFFIKLVVFLLLCVVAGPYCVDAMADHTRAAIEAIPRIAREGL